MYNGYIYDIYRRRVQHSPSCLLRLRNDTLVKLIQGSRLNTLTRNLHVIVSLACLANVLSHDYLSYINALVSFFIYFHFLSGEGPTFETLDFSIRIGSPPTLCIFRFLLCLRRILRRLLTYKNTLVTARSSGRACGIFWLHNIGRRCFHKLDKS